MAPSTAARSIGWEPKSVLSAAMIRSHFDGIVNWALRLVNSAEY
jgi:hypothetical protein